MLQWNPETLETEQAVSILLTKAETEWNKRKQLYERFRRKTSYSELVCTDDKKMKVALEYYITIMTTGFFAGKPPIYEVKRTVDDEETKNIIKKLFDKVLKKNNSKELKTLIDYITKYNDDPSEFYYLAFNFFCMGACYETMYENKDNEIVYARQSPLNTIAIYDYSTPENLVGKLRKWTETDLKGNEIIIVELETIHGKRYYSSTPENYKELQEDKNKYEESKWEDIPFLAVESEYGLSCFELVISVICGYERVLRNSRNTFQYNDEAKLKVTGYQPENSTVIQNEKGEWIENPARIKEDEQVLKSKVFYTPVDGDLSWVEKNINDNALQNYKKTLIDLIFLITGVPNASDLGFTNADNAAALDRKFFPLEQMITMADIELRKQLLRRWELVLGKINKKKHTTYDFRDIKVKLFRNLPTDKKSETDRALSLKGTLSDETVLGMLPDDIDVQAEIRAIQKQEEENMNKFLENTRQETDKSNIEKENNNEEFISNVGQSRRSDLQKNKTD